MENSISIDIKPQNKIDNNWKTDEFLNNALQKCDLNEKKKYESFENNNYESFEKDYLNSLEENREENKEENREEKKNNFIMKFLTRILKNSSKLTHSPWVGPSIGADI